MTFERPALLWGLPLLVPLALLVAFSWRRLRPSLGLYGGARGLSLPALFRRFALSSLSFLVFAALSIIALAGPRAGTAIVQDTRRFTDTAIALDLSLSMDLRDASGETGQGVSRLERALDLARDLAERGGAGARFAVAIGKGAGTLALPLTQDTEAIRAFFDGISTGSITGQGTNLENLIDAAAGAFQAAFSARRFIVLFSDGESLQGNIAKALDAAAEKEIAIIAVGLGSDGGAPVSGPENGGWSRRDRAALENAAHRTGGIYVDGNDENAAGLIEQGIAGPGGQGRSQAVAHWFILPGIVFFALSKIAGRKRKT